MAMKMSKEALFMITPISSAVTYADSTNSELADRGTHVLSHRTLHVTYSHGLDASHIAPIDKNKQL